MSSTAKARINAMKDLIEADLKVLTHPDDREAYITEVRTLLSLKKSVERRSPHDKHGNPATDDHARAA
jgi:hypothetical protein